MSRAELHIPIILLGLPLEKSENPYLVLPLKKRLIIEYEIKNESRKEISISIDPYIDDLLLNYTNNILEALELTDTTVRIKRKLNEKLPKGGLYAAVSAFLLYKIADIHGESLETYEIIEYARLYDDFELSSGWEYVIDALRYSAIQGGAVVYRNDEEYGEISQAKIDWFEGVETKKVKKQRYNIEDYGPDVYGAIIHLIGTIVLEAAMRVKESEEYDLMKILKSLIDANNNIAGLFWRDLMRKTVYSNVIFSPGLPGEFDIIYF
ncbi:MAG: hypothetical protein GSR81_03440 [Desulfurococcales archaeon]|nr:hypothetical protein [Desulfurococcales archaeon]